MSRLEREKRGEALNSVEIDGDGFLSHWFSPRLSRAGAAVTLGRTWAEAGFFGSQEEIFGPPIHLRRGEREFPLPCNYAQAID